MTKNYYDEYGSGVAPADRPCLSDVTDVPWEDRSICRVDHQGHCFTCGEMTHYVDLIFEVYLCSNACTRKMHSDFLRHAEKMSSCE
jgi:UTP-glucose-1-phosphate uridylyltransferase